MRQAGRLEGIGHVCGLRPVIAQREPRQQAALALGQHLRAGGQGAAQPVGRRAGGPAGTPPDNRVDDEAAGDVPVAEEALVRPGPLHRSDHGHPFSGHPVVECGGGRGPRHRPQPPAAQPHVDGCAAAPVGVGIAHEGDLALDGPGFEGPRQPGHTPLAE